ncbi:MAG: hypothetical protein E7658_06840 [Ruminococcaceae bacterium]|nr:hypothetical protein [Oscillospiraceae bacterium]
MNTSPFDFHKTLASGMTPLYAFDENEDLNTQRTRATEKLKELLGMDTFTRCDPDVTVTKEEIKDGVRRIHFTVQTETGYYVHCDFLLPAEIEKPLPLCVCLQGHSNGAHISLGEDKYPGDAEDLNGGDRDFAVRAVKEGFCALAVEQRAFGENGGGGADGSQCDFAAKVAVLLGRSLIGERVWDVSRILDVVESKFSHFATLEGSVCVGNSGGGTATYYIACLEDRFSGYMPSCALCTFRDSIIDMHHCGCNYVPGVAKYFDMGDLAVMIAPRKLVVVAGVDDGIFPIHGVKESYEIIRNLYKLAGAENNCRLVVGSGGHRFYADDAWPVMHELLAR